MHRAVQVDQRTADLDRRFDATDPGTTCKARRLLVMSFAALDRCAGEKRPGFGACHFAPSVGERRQSQRPAVIESRNA
jgi:hypothetical protein